jgi:hypothetical protein
MVFQKSSFVMLLSHIKAKGSATKWNRQHLICVGHWASTELNTATLSQTQAVQSDS